MKGGGEDEKYKQKYMGKEYIKKYKDDQNVKRRRSKEQKQTRILNRNKKSLRKRNERRTGVLNKEILCERKSIGMPG